MRSSSDREFATELQHFFLLRPRTLEWQRQTVEPWLEHLFASVGGITAEHCAFCGTNEGPFTQIQGLFTVAMCPACLAHRARGRGPYPDLTNAEMRAGLNLLPTWVLKQKAAANRQVIATTMRARLERGEPVVPMYGPLGLAWLQRQADIAEQLIRARGQPPPPHSQAANPAAPRLP